MIEYRNECCDCAVPGYPCLGDACHNRHVPHVFCDVCGQEIYDDDVNLSGDYHICSDCKEEEELCDTCANHYMDDCGWCCIHEGDEGCEFWHEDVKKCALYKKEDCYD